MTILVDALFDDFTPGTFWCHMVSDESVSELHAFAKKIGLRREWAQESSSGVPHYDLRGQRMRTKALQAGAKEATRLDIVQKAVRS